MATVVAAVATIATGSAVAGTAFAASMIGTAISTAIIGAAVGATVAAVTGGDIGKGAIMGAVAGGVAGGVGYAVSGPAATAGAGTTVAATPSMEVASGMGAAITPPVAPTTGILSGVKDFIKTESGGRIAASAVAEGAKAMLTEPDTSRTDIESMRIAQENKIRAESNVPVMRITPGDVGKYSGASVAASLRTDLDTMNELATSLNTAPVEAGELSVAV